MQTSIPLSVIIVTKNEEARIGACLEALSRFDDVWVVDSNSSDKTCEIARAHGAQIENFSWNGKYPKKRGWCLAHLPLKYEAVFFVDADEIVPPDLVDEIAALNWDKPHCAGYFVRGRYCVAGQVLKHGLCNNKLALFDRRKVEFPIVDDLDLEGMGEIEGHYQPVLKGEYAHEKIGQLQRALLHNAYDNAQQWEARHARYAAWEAGMNARGAWPRDPLWWRQMLKQVFRALPFRGLAAFVQSYVFKLGFLDGAAGYRFARSRARYYRMISDASKGRARSGAASTERPAEP